MHPFFTELGRTVLDRWKRQNFSLAAFPDIATAALDKRPPARHVDLPALMRDFLLNDDQPFQTDSDFGEPELVAFNHPRFYVQLLFWMDGTTAIHQHEFSGAFHVMHGSSIHAHYDFLNPRPVTPYLRVGDLRMRHMELLQTGRTVPIVSGPRTIHSLFHLDSPSVTVVVRTQNDPGTGPQFNYLPPHVALDPHFSDKLTLRRKQLLDVLERVGDPTYPDVVREMLADLDFERGFSVLHNAMPHLQHLEQWDRTLRAFNKKHGPLAAGVEATLNETARRSVIKGMRATVVDPEHRFFLALLMNAPTRADLLALVAQRYPKQTPTDVVMRWVHELTEVSDDGVSILDAAFPHGSTGNGNGNGEGDGDGDADATSILDAFASFLTRDRKRPKAKRGPHALQIDRIRATFAESTLGPLVG